jgi:hypothetical protein
MACGQLDYSALAFSGKLDNCEALAEVMSY